MAFFGGEQCVYFFQAGSCDILIGVFHRHVFVVCFRLSLRFPSWNQFHSILQQHPLHDQAECHSGEWFVALKLCKHSPHYCTCTSQFIIFALRKSLWAWKACSGSPGRRSWRWCRWQQQQRLLSHSVLLTDMETVRSVRKHCWTPGSSRNSYKYFRKQHFPWFILPKCICECDWFVLKVVVVCTDFGDGSNCSLSAFLLENCLPPSGVDHIPVFPNSTHTDSHTWLLPVYLE